MGRGPSIPIFLGPLTCVHRVRKENQILHGYQKCEKKLQGRSRILTRDPFAVANLLVHCGARLPMLS